MINTPLDREPAASPADALEALAFRLSEIGLTASLTALDGLLYGVPDGDTGYGEAALTASALAYQMLDGTASLMRTLASD